MGQTRIQNMVRQTGRTPEQLVLLTALILVGALILLAGRHLGFFYDDWDYVLGRRAVTLHTYLAPHNGHPSVTAVLAYQMLFALVGLGHYLPYLVPVLALHLACVVFLFLLARPRVGERAALIPALLLLVLSASSQNLLWAAQETYLASVAGGLAAFLLIERGTRGGDVAAAVALTVAVFSSTLGIPFVIGVAIELALRPGRRRALWVPAVPLVLYGLWALGYQGGSEDSLKLSNVGAVPGYVADIASAAAAGIAGLSVSYGPVLLIGGALAIAVARLSGPGARPATPRLAALAGATLAYWVLTALARAQLHEPAANRYVYLGAVFLLLIAVELLGPPRRWSPAGGVAVVVLLGGILIGDVHGLRQGERSLRGIWEPLRPELAALEIAGARAAPSAAIDVHLAPQIAPGPYLRAVAQHGSPTGGLAWLARAPEVRRISGDATLARIEGLHGVPAPRPGAARCGAAETTVVRRVAPGRALVVAPAPGQDRTISLRRLAGTFGAPIPTVPGTVRVATVRDGAPVVPWVVRVTSPRPVRACVG